MPSKKKLLSVRLRHDEVAQLDALAKELRLTRNQLVERLVVSVLALQGKLSQIGLFDTFGPLMEASIKDAVERSMPSSLAGLTPGPKSNVLRTKRSKPGRTRR